MTTHILPDDLPDEDVARVSGAAHTHVTALRQALADLINDDRDARPSLTGDDFADYRDPLRLIGVPDTPRARQGLAAIVNTVMGRVDTGEEPAAHCGSTYAHAEHDGCPGCDPHLVAAAVADDRPPYDVLWTGLSAVASDAVARQQYALAGYAYSVLAGEPIPVPDEGPVATITVNMGDLDADTLAAALRDAGMLAATGDDVEPLHIEVDDDGDVRVINPHVLNGRGVLVTASNPEQ